MSMRLHSVDYFVSERKLMENCTVCVPEISRVTDLLIGAERQWEGTK